MRLQGVALLDILWARRLTKDNVHEYLDLRPGHNEFADRIMACLLYTSDAADE